MCDASHSSSSKRQFEFYTTHIVTFLSIENISNYNKWIHVVATTTMGPLSCHIMVSWGGGL